MKVVWKYGLKQLNASSPEPYEVGRFDLPPGSMPLTVQYQGNDPMLWVAVDPDYKGEGNLKVVVYSVGTGFGVVPDGATYLNTLQRDGFVWHLFYNLKVTA